MAFVPCLYAAHMTFPPMPEEENQEWEEGGDPCCVVVRVYRTREEYNEIEVSPQS